MGKLFWILLLGFCLLTVRATEDKEEEEDASEEGADAGSGAEDESEEAEDAGAEAEETKEFQCNLKFKRFELSVAIFLF